MRALTAHPLKPGQQLVILSQVGGLLIYASGLVYTYKIALWFSSVLQFVNSWTPCLSQKLIRTVQSIAATVSKHGV